MHALFTSKLSVSNFPLVPGTLLGILFLFAITFIIQSKYHIPGQKKVKQRKWGHWIPISFSYPQVIPSPDPMDLKPIPYRPFRWGEYYVTMGIREMPWDEWMELDDQILSYYYIKKHRIATQGVNVVQVLSDRVGEIQVKSASQSAIELVHELADYLSKRYPDIFTASYNAELGYISQITIIPVKETFTLPPPLIENPKLFKRSWTKLRRVSIEEAENALKIAVLLVQDDIALMLEGTDGRYYFQGGAICIPGFWRMRDKLGLSLEEIHIEGNVPQSSDETKLRTAMNRHFQRMAVDKPIIRNNYSIQVIPPKDIRCVTKGVHSTSIEAMDGNDSSIDPEELSWSSYTNGPEEAFVHGNRYPTSTDKTDPVVVLPENLRLRSERQTLRRLPLSGAIVFGIRTYIFPLEDLVKEPGVPARMASAIRSWPADVRQYKGSKLYEGIALEYLDKNAEKQRLEGGEELVKDSRLKYPY
ncbi:hypothetical protein GYMLUDRAFT_88154 [Collybiopsis luxurians FD-317 M1]|uniref:Uncharacterized protein n=1 Tax=Collybiopsis luxurians FD-317 M1 TaxID=944289 RepID=A0A0D0BX42_9AGAR|nr:hypothetical protein GYMLUDRAFT_88154 [Collybiopsis luxurians FD-317 M1]